MSTAEWINSFILEFEESETLKLDETSWWRDGFTDRQRLVEKTLECGHSPDPCDCPRFYANGQTGAYGQGAGGIVKASLSTMVELYTSETRREIDVLERLTILTARIEDGIEETDEMTPKEVARWFNQLAEKTFIGEQK